VRIIGSHLPSRIRNLGEAQTQGGIWLGSWLNPKTQVWDPWNEQSPGAAMLMFALASNRVRVTALERACGVSGGQKPRRVKPQEWNWDETSPAGHEGSKASKGCETPRA
jgi:hypothetical protein